MKRLTLIIISCVLIAQAAMAGEGGRDMASWPVYSDTTEAVPTLPNEIAHDSRNYQDDTGFYVIEFEYYTGSCMVPATIPLGKPHYAATITVYQIIDGKKVMIGKPFDGQYIPGGCFEDASDYLVEKAKNLAKGE